MFVFFVCAFERPFVFVCVFECLCVRYVYLCVHECMGRVFICACVCVFECV